MRYKRVTAVAVGIFALWATWWLRPVPEVSEVRIGECAQESDLATASIPAPPRVPVEGLAGLGTRGSGTGGGVGYGLGIGSLGTAGYGRGGGRFGGKQTLPLSKDWHGWPENRFQFVDADFLATFSVDVDTGSYTQARRMLRSAVLPPRESVRSEEFVNYQQYRYPEPEDGLPFSITMEAAPHPWLTGHHVLRVGIRGANPPKVPSPVHLTFLVDTSCSMTPEDRLPLAKSALHVLVDGLGPQDTVAIATYAGETRVVLPSTAASERERLHSAIDGLRNGGGTAMQSGMELAYALAERGFVAGHENRVIVLSDGDANIGASDHDSLLAAIAGYAGRGITLSTVGFGSGNYRDHLMEQLADKGDGNYVYIDDLDEARRVFREDLGATLRTIARDVKIQVVFDRANVFAYKLMGYENRLIADEDFRDDAVDAAEVGAGHTVTALFDLVLRENRSGALATVRVRHKAPGPDAPAAEQAVVMPAAAIAPRFEDATGDLHLALGAAAFAMKLRGVPELAAVSFDEVAEAVASGRREGSDRDDELLELVRQASRLAGGAG